MKKNIFALSFVVFLVIAAVFYFLTGLLSKYKAEDLERLTVEKSRAAVRVSIPSINKSIENSDDIGLLINIESLARFENISSCFILDRDNNVIIHNNTNEWNTVRKGEIYDKAIRHNAELLQLTPDKDHMLFSAPLAKNNTLCCIFSTQKASETANAWKIRYFTVAAAAALLISVILYFLAKLFILIPFKKTKKALEDMSSGSIKNAKYNEITDIFMKENDKTSAAMKALRENRESLAGIINYFSQIAFKERKHEAFIVLDSHNNIVFSGDKTGTILKKDHSAGSNIIEAAANHEIIELVAKANENPEKEAVKNINGVEISALSIKGNAGVEGTVIKDR